MCRLLGYVTVCDQVVGEALADALPTFTDLSALHKDGWGMAWFDGAGIRVRREAVEARRSEEYAAAVSDTVTDAALLHLRMATPGLGVNETNTHPFLRDGIGFAHNGEVGPVDAIKAMCAPERTPEGITDSEWYFLAVLSAMDAGLAPGAALARTAARLMDLEVTNSVNAMMLTDEALYVVCGYHRERGHAQFDVAYPVVSYLKTEDGVTVGSSGLPQDGWPVMPNRSLLTVTRGSLDCDLTSF